MGKLVVLLLLAALVVLASLYMLAKSKKDQLGRGFTIISYVMAGFGILVFVFGITAGIMHAVHHKGSCGGKGKCKGEMSCPMMKGHGGMDECKHGMSCGSGHGSKMMKNCGGKSECKMGGGMKCHMMENDGEEEMVKEIIIEKSEKGDPKIEVKVEKEAK